MNFYFQAAKVLDRLDAKQGSVKGLVSSVPEKDKKRTQALVIETLKYKPVLKDVVAAANVMQKESKKLTSPNLVLLLVHDLLFSDGIQAGDGPIKQAILRHKTRLRGELEKYKIKHGARSHKDLARTGDERAALIPRYVRVNTLKTSLKATLVEMASKGYTLADGLESGVHVFTNDEHIPNLLLFPPQTSFSEDPMYKLGKIILQDKASCFPAYILHPPASDGTVVIDATAAPGNKTSHLAAIMKNLGKLYAFEKDPKRFSTLQSMVLKAGCTNVVTVCSDFLLTDPLDPKFAQVSHILLDPSCSGSGIVNRLDYLVESEDGEGSEESRLAKLSAFQLSMIRHAMKFPNVSRVVYSTCSIHAIENEQVVRQALVSSEAQIHSFRLAPPDQVLTGWRRRGLESEMDDPEQARSLVRCLPGEDATNGFFVACFIKDGSRKRKSNDVATDSKKTPKRKKK